MNSSFSRNLFLISALLATVTSARAEVLDSSDSHYRLRHEGASALNPAELWARLTVPASWWSPAHSYSGDAEHLSLELDVGGYWSEVWDGGAVAHGRVLLIQPEKTLRLEAPFGPLQGIGAYVIWTITLAPEGDGTRVVFSESATAPTGAGLDGIAPAVDAVKSEAMQRLVANP